MTKTILENGTRKAVIKKKSSGGWCVALFFNGEIVAEKVCYFSTKKECVFEAELFLQN